MEYLDQHSTTLGILGEQATMKSLEEIRISVNPPITADQLFSFYEKNDICEKG